jgi:hypothetical protein
VSGILPDSDTACVLANGDHMSYRQPLGVGSTSDIDISFILNKTPPAPHEQLLLMILA